MQPMLQHPPEGDPVASDESRLVSDVLAKDRKATAEFVSRCVDYAYPFVCRRLMPRTELVEDLMQEIMLAAWQSLGSFRGSSGLRSWILGIARHKTEDYYRKRVRAMEVHENEDENFAEPAMVPRFEEYLDSASQQERVQQTIAALPEAYALALIWRYRDSRSLGEMAELTGKTEKAMERLLARARESFRKRWSDV
jgi:RNA polymerase sigma-70 factor (ECF subfamily)